MIYKGRYSGMYQKRKDDRYGFRVYEGYFDKSRIQMKSLYPSIFFFYKTRRDYEIGDSL
jgi:hypothetical protein